MNQFSKRWWRTGLGILIWIGLLAALASGWESARSQLIGSARAIIVAIPLIALGLVGGAMGWAELQPQGARKRALRAFLAAQPAKYLPAGGAFQLISQVGMTISDGSERTRTGIRFVVHALVQVVSASSVALLLLVGPPVQPSWLPVAIVVAALVLPATLRASAIDRGVGFIQRVLRSIDLGGSPPSTRSLWRSWAWTLLPLLLSGLAFALLTGQDPSVSVILATIGAFSAAWLVGFIAFPLPSGLGLREIVLIQLLPALAPPEVIATSVLQRFSTVVAELLVLLLVSRRTFFTPSAS